MNGFLRGMILGAFAGALVGILFAPKSGKETREEIKQKVEGLSRDFRDKFSQLKMAAKERYGSRFDELMEDYQDSDLSRGQREEIRSELKKCFAKIKDIAQEEN